MRSASRLLITGAAGQIGSAVSRRLLSLWPHMRLVDIRRPDIDSPRIECVVGDLRDEGVRRDALGDVDAVLHFAASSSLASVSDVHETHVDLACAVLEDARRAGVPRVVMASSMHVLGFYRRDTAISLASTARPDSPYAEAKCLMEAHALAERRHGSSAVTCVRIGCFSERREDAEPYSWIGPDDLAGLLQQILSRGTDASGVVHAVAPYGGDDCGQREFERRTGFRFQHRGGRWSAEQVKLNQWYHADFCARQYRGGTFASSTLRGQWPPIRLES